MFSFLYFLSRIRRFNVKEHAERAGVPVNDISLVSNV